MGLRAITAKGYKEFSAGNFTFLYIPLLKPRMKRQRTGREDAPARKMCAPSLARMNVSYVSFGLSLTDVQSEFV